MNPMESRSSHPSAAQLESLVQFLEMNPDLAKGYSKNPSARARSNLKWEEATKRLNSLGGTIKPSKKWVKYWSDKKSAVKRKAAARNAARRRTGGGVEDVPELSEVEERILAIMGGDRFAVGDSHLQIDLFGPSTSQQQDSPSILSDMPESSQASGPIHIFDAEDGDMTLGHRNQSQVLQVIQVDPAAGSSRTLTLPSPCLPASPTAPPARPPAHSPTPPTRTESEALRNAAAGTTSKSHQSLYSLLMGTGLSTSLSYRPQLCPRAPRRPRRSRVLHASPPSQRRSQFRSLTEKFLRLEEQRLDVDRRLVAVLEQGAERERLTAQAHIALGEGLKALADAINSRR